MSVYREVAVILRLNMDYDRKIAVGISRYAHQAGDWRIYLEDEPRNKLPALRDWHGHGVIAYLREERVQRFVLGLGIPVVGVGGFRPPDFCPAKVAYVGSDNARIGSLAADHLLERGLRHFAYCGIPHIPFTSWLQAREQGFRARVREAGFLCTVFRGRYRRPFHWDAMLDELGAWLIRQPKPLGLMACYDPRARHVLLACRRSRLRIPEDVAIVGVDNDRIMCEMVQPTLTSIEQGSEQVGYEAAALLDQFMRRGRRKSAFVTIPPIGLIARQSTDINQLDDAAVAAALKFLKEHLAEAVDPDSAAKQVHLSRRMLDLRFRRAIGRSIHAEIRRLRLDLVHQLLTTTDLAMKTIGRRAGYASVQYLSNDFRRAFGQPPGAFRRANASPPAILPFSGEEFGT